jgi:heterodisulfide reductase subunit B
MRAIGAEPVMWDSKVACCGASLSLTQTEIVLEMSKAILDNARARQADVVAVACPLCHANLDGRQMHMGVGEPVPVLYFTQLMALAFDLKGQAALERNLVDPRPLLTSKGWL